MKDADPVCEAEVMSAEDPLFILYTSGSTGKNPKGVQHNVGGYMIYAAMTHKYILIIRMGIFGGVQQILVG
jgi:acetyl-coenzyme A synthetase (EC 6.2.1.1)